MTSFRCHCCGALENDQDPANKPIDFFAFPPEVRNFIYYCALPRNRLIRTDLNIGWHRLNTTFAVPLPRPLEVYDLQDIDETFTTPPLLLVNKRIRNEASAIFAKQNDFRITTNIYRDSFNDMANRIRNLSAFDYRYLSYRSMQHLCITMNVCKKDRQFRNRRLELLCMSVEFDGKNVKGSVRFSGRLPNDLTASYLEAYDTFCEFVKTWNDDVEIEELMQTNESKVDYGRRLP